MPLTIFTHTISIDHVILHVLNSISANIYIEVLITLYVVVVAARRHALSSFIV